MSDTYQIGSVTITAQGGGWYELTHPSLAEPVKVQGKENADDQAAAMSDEIARNADSTMQGQPPLDDALKQQDAAEVDERENLKKQLAESQAARAEEQASRLAAERERDELAKKIETRTVRTDGGDVPPPASRKVPAGIPRRFEGILDDTAKAELKRLGIETTRIVLEENDSIPPTGLFLGHNGRGYMIMPGEEVDVPNFLLGVLNRAVMSAPVVDSKSQKVVGYRNRMRYPYRRVG